MKLLHLLVTLSVLIGAAPLYAQLHYIDIVPDTTIQSPDDEEYRDYLMDVDGDGDIDFEFYHFTPIGDPVNRGIELYFGDGASDYAVMTTMLNWQPLPAALNEGDVIGQISSQYPWTTRNSGSFMGAAFLNRNDRTGEPWEGVTDKYLAFALIEGADWYYGWIRFDVPADASSFTVKDYAINLTANEGLTAGLTAPVGVHEVPVADGDVSVLSLGNTLVVQFARQSPDERSMTLYNLLGTKLGTYPLDGSRTSIPVASYPAGTYLAVVRDGARVQSTLVQVW